MQLDRLEALISRLEIVSRLEMAAAGPPVARVRVGAVLRRAWVRAWRRMPVLTPCAVAGAVVTLAGFGVDRICYGRYLVRVRVRVRVRVN